MFQKKGEVTDWAYRLQVGAFNYKVLKKLPTPSSEGSWPAGGEHGEGGRAARHAPREGRRWKDIGLEGLLESCLRLQRGSGEARSAPQGAARGARGRVHCTQGGRSARRGPGTGRAGRIGRAGRAGRKERMGSAGRMERAGRTGEDRVRGEDGARGEGRAQGARGGSGARGGACARPAPLLGDAGMFTLRTAAAAGGWAAARLAVGTSRAERRVGARACSVRGGGAAGGGDRLRASRPQPPAQRAFPRRRLAEPPAHPGSSRAGERKPPNFLVSGARVPGAGTRAGRGGRDRAGRPQDPPARGVGRGARAPAGWGFRSCRGAAAAAGGGTLAPGTGSGARGRHGRRGS